MTVVHEAVEPGFEVNRPGDTSAREQIERKESDAHAEIANSAWRILKFP